MSAAKMVARVRLAGQIGVGEIASGQIQAFEDFVRKVRPCAAHAPVHQELVLAAGVINLKLAQGLILDGLADHLRSIAGTGAHAQRGVVWTQSS